MQNENAIKMQWQKNPELDLQDALRIAIHMHQTGNCEDAEVLYRRILDVAPGCSDAIHFLGVLLHQRGESSAAIDLIEKSISLDPAQPGRYNNLGNVLLELERFAEAANAFRQAIHRQPGHADAYNNLGAVLRAQGQLDEAGVAYRKAIEFDPTHADAHNNLGNLLSSQGKNRDAVFCYAKAITLVPDHPQARKLLGVAYCTLGQIDAAAQVFQQWRQEEPENPVAQHMYAACSGQGVPQRASDAYIEKTFDVFAASFDARLGKLGYCAPELAAAALEQACPAPAHQLSILDAGCGTGWCGPLIASYACRLVGVDLSSGMLQRAKARGVYDELVHAELQSYLADHQNGFDVVISVDTFVYFGALADVLKAAGHSLKENGVLVFTVEECAAAETGYRLNTSGRYSHGRDYVERTMHDAGFAVININNVQLRMEGGGPVSGMVMTGRKLGAELTRQ